MNKRPEECLQQFFAGTTPALSLELCLRSQGLCAAWRAAARDQFPRGTFFMKLFACAVVGLLLFSSEGSVAVYAQTPAAGEKQKVIFDTDIGDNLDDAFALDLVLVRPELEVLGVSTAWGDTALRARLTARMLCDLGKNDIPVLAGPRTEAKSALTQAKW